MKYNFIPMNQEYANEIVTHWKYDGEYSIYDYANEADHMLGSESWGKGLFAVLNEKGDLLGELTTEFFDENDDYIEYDDFDDEKLNRAEMWIGFGLKPEFTGLGLGTGFVSACIEFAVAKHNYTGEYVRLGVATFNKRAINVYERIGFEVFNETVGEIDGKEFQVVHMRKHL
ncbi:MAG: GNAT family N-acetyltransferase [Chloroflexi bacterium]|nr:GNAT family N-acetyltransferase [Chloroflexota bacterium]